MNKYLLLGNLLFLSIISQAQKYVLIDQAMREPVQYKEEVTLKDTYHNIFVVEKCVLGRFVEELSRLVECLSKKKVYETRNVNFSNTSFCCKNLVVDNEGRVDVMLITVCKDATVSMHLSDAKYSNAQNAFFIKTWLAYIRSFL